MVAEDRLERLENDLKHQAKEAEDTAAITLQEQRLASEEHLAATLEAQKAKVSHFLIKFAKLLDIALIPRTFFTNKFNW